VPELDIWALRWDVRNIEKLAQHGVDWERPDQVLDNHNIVYRNRRDRAAPYSLVGFDDSGAAITLPIRPTDEPGIWRPVTGWYAKPSELARLRQRRRR
jgi:hypothetical protein